MKKIYALYIIFFIIALWLIQACVAIGNKVYLVKQCTQVDVTKVSEWHQKSIKKNNSLLVKSNYK